VNTLDDFKGKKIRTPGLFSKLVQNMGGVPVQLPATEQYVALQRGTVDGTLFVYFGLDVWKLKEVVKYVTIPPVLSNSTTSLYANQKAWDTLPDDMKKVLAESFKETMYKYSGAAMKADEAGVKAAEQAGVKVVELSDADMEKLRDLAIPIWDEIAKKNTRCAKLVELIKEFYIGKKYSE
jgi:TRAP-type C4-dicarboxylate transport system substrate-binding protein